MSVKRSLISFLLLLVYTISFGHNLIPHSHSGDIFSQNHSTVLQSSDCDCTDIGTEGDKNNGHSIHLENNVFDYVFHVLNELENKDLGIVHETLVEAQTKPFSFDNSMHNFVFESFIVLAIVELKALVSYFQVSKLFVSEYLVSTPHRGPPIIS